MDYILNDSQIVFKPYSSKCSVCRYFNRSEFNCIGFQKGIPEIILTGENDHSKPLPDQDNNIVFEVNE